MDVKYINPFIDGSRRVLEELTGLKLQIEAPRLMSETISGNELIVIVGLTGEIKGQAMFTMDEHTALKIAEKMSFSDMELTELNEYAESAIQEMANMISGSTSMVMYNDGIVIDITPPSLCKGSSMIITSKNKFITIPLNIETVGKFNINVSFEKVNK